MNKNIQLLINSYFNNELNENTTNEDIINSYLKTNNFKNSVIILPTNIADETTVENCAPFLIENEVYKLFKKISENNKDVQISLLFNNKSSKVNREKYNNSSFKVAGITIPRCDFILKIGNIPYLIEIKSIKDGDENNISITNNQNILSYRYIYIIVSYNVKNTSINLLNIQCIDSGNLLKNKTTIKTQIKNIVKKFNNHKL